MRVKHPVIPFVALIVFGFLISRLSYGVDFETNKSTNPVTASTLAVLSDSDPGDILGSLLINSRATAPETIKLYDSSGTATNLIGTISISSGVIGMSSEYRYNLRVSSAITFTKSGGTSDITIIWKNVR